MEESIERGIGKDDSASRQAESLASYYKRLVEIPDYDLRSY